MYLLVEDKIRQAYWKTIATVNGRGEQFLSLFCKKQHMIK